MKNNIILFSPLAWEIPESGIIQSDATFKAGVPLSILAVATFLERDGYPMAVVSGAESDCLARIASLLDDNTICVGISSMTGSQIAQGVEVAKIVRRRNKAIPIVWGGFHPSILPEQTAKSPYVDVVVRGYGERTFFHLVKAIERGKSLDSIKGLTFLRDGELVSTSEGIIENIDEFPPIPYHLIDVPRFLTRELGRRTLAYISSRGCPNDCQFCADRVVYKRRWNALSADRVLDDLSRLKERYSIDAVRFYDSNFFIDETRVQAICRGMIDRRLNLRWGRANGNVETLIRYREETWSLMRKSGCFSILVGAESGYDKALKKIKKRTSIEMVEALSRVSKQYGIRIIYSFMLGIPIDLADYDSQRENFRKEVARTMELILKLLRSGSGFDRVLLFRFTPYPGSGLYEECKSLGWREPASLEEWCNNTLWKSRLPWLIEEESSIVDSLIELVKIASPSVSFPDTSFKKRILSFLGKFS